MESGLVKINGKEIEFFLISLDECYTDCEVTQFELDEIYRVTDAVRFARPVNRKYER
jgi:hypothetical protein